MPHDPLHAAAALSQLKAAQARFLEAQDERRHAIVAAVRADIPLREVADAAHCSHETIRRIVAADGEVTVEFAGHGYPVPGQTIELLIYKLAGFAGGTFAPDLKLLGVGTEWLATAGVLANELHAAMVDEEGKPVPLDDPRGFALHQILRLTEMTRPSSLSRLAEALSDAYGYPPYQETALLHE
jgi:hypothetical protein